MYQAHDLLAEICTAMEEHEESERHTYEVEIGERDTARVTVTCPHGKKTRFILTVREA